MSRWALVPLLVIFAALAGPTAAADPSPVACVAGVLGDKSADAAKALGRKSTELGRGANKAIKDSAKTLDSLAPRSGKLKSYTDYVERGADSGLGRTLDHTGTKAVKEGTKAINDTLNPDEGS